MTEKPDKAFRLLQLHERLSKGESIIKSTAMSEFSIDNKTFQRDIDSLRQYCSEYNGAELAYDRKSDCYRLKTKAGNLTKEEIFAVCKVIIESRAFNKMEFEAIITKLLYQCEITEAKAVSNMIANERIDYLPLQHGKLLVNRLWQLATLVKKQIIADISYKRTDGAIRTYEIKPVGIMFSEFYFYMIAYMANDSKESPTVFRVDRINAIKVTGKTFCVPYAEKFSESEFRKRVQFMYTGELHTIRFLYTGVLEAVQDRLPTARVERKTDEGVIVRAEVYGNGADMWLQSQGNKVKVLSKI